VYTEGPGPETAYRPFFYDSPRYTKHLRHLISPCVMVLLAALCWPVLDAADTSKQATAKSKSRAAKTAAKKVPPKPRYYAQLQPSPERYREIQQALADKGYFSGTPDGVWGATSTDALKRFQHDQNLTEDGKVDSLSLIALGLGPKRAVSSAAPIK